MTGTRYKVISGKYSRTEGAGRVRYRPGDTFIPTSEEIQKLGKTIRPVIESPSIDKVEEPKPQTSGPVPLSVKEEDLGRMLKHTGGGWYKLSTSGEKVKGKQAALDRLKGDLRKFDVLEE